MPVEFAAYCFLAGVAFISLNVKKPKLSALAHLAAFALALAAFAYFSIQSNGFMMRVFRPVTFFMIGALYCDYAEKIVLNRVAGIIALLLSIAAGFTPIFNFVLMVTLPYAIVSLCLGTKQIRSVGFIGKISYEMYLIGVPIQQTVVAVNGGAMQRPWLLFLIASAVDIILAWCLFTVIGLLDNRVKSRFKKTEKSK
jgi:peptidoglycan/LPS O-acetylase OafA/YrhL